MWLGRGRSIRAGKVMGRQGGCQRGWNLARGHREAHVHGGWTAQGTHLSWLPDKEGALLQEPTACPQYQGAAPTPRDKAPGDGKGLRHTLVRGEAGTKAAAMGRTQTRGSSDKGRPQAEGQRPSQKGFTAQHTGLPTWGSSPSRATYLAGWPLGHRYQGPAPHGPREGRDQPEIPADPSPRRSKGEGVLTSAPLPSHKGLRIRPALEPLPSHNIHRQSPGTASENTVSPQILWPQCLSGQMPAVPMAREEIVTQTPYGHRSHVITQEGRPEAQTEREMAVQSHPPPPPCQHPPLRPMPHPPASAWESQGGRSWERTEVHPCLSAGPRSTVGAQPSAASPGGSASSLWTLSLASIISWGCPRGVHTGGDRNHTLVGTGTKRVKRPWTQRDQLVCCWGPEGPMPDRAALDHPPWGRWQEGHLSLCTSQTPAPRGPLLPSQDPAS